MWVDGQVGGHVGGWVMLQGGGGGTEGSWCCGSNWACRQMARKGGGVTWVDDQVGKVCARRMAVGACNGGCACQAVCQDTESLTRLLPLLALRMNTQGLACSAMWTCHKRCAARVLLRSVRTVLCSKDLTLYR